MNTGTQAIRQKWIKKGLIYKPSGQCWWSRSYASVPTVDTTDDKVCRIYFGTRDDMNRNRISYIEVEAGNLVPVLYEHDAPVLDLGRLGTFDDCGVMPSWILNHDGKKYLYYIGWTVRTTIPYHNSIGLAISTDGGRSFERFSEGPLIAQTYSEPFIAASCSVLVEEGLWRNWYLSGTGWTLIDGKAEPRYHIKYAESGDGIHWIRKGLVAVDYKSAQEAGIARPSVLRELANSSYVVLASRRSRLPYESRDELPHWLRGIARRCFMASLG